MKKLGIVAILFAMVSCAEMQQVMNSLPQSTSQTSGNISNSQIALGLKEALNLGVENGIAQLGKSGGFFKNEAVKILLPNELQDVDKTLRKLGLGSLADKGLQLLNNAAEDAVVEAAPIFSNAIREITFTDAKNILLGNKTAATNYLQNKTTQQLVSTFQPNIRKSLDKVGANEIWSKLILKYNLITGKNLDTDLSNYVTQKTVDGVFTMVAEKEKDIRSNVFSRNTSLLKKVFALQDK